MSSSSLRLGLLGYPVTHSLSPALFAYFGAQANRAIGYELLSLNIPQEKEERALTSTLQWAFDELHLQALNITAPYKVRVGALCQSRQQHPKPETTEAVNLVWQDRGAWYATNTDFAGAAYLVEFAKIRSYQTPVLVVGAGGAVVPVLEALCAQGIETICCNRTNEKAQALAEKYSAAYLGYEELAHFHEHVVLFSVLPHYVPFPPINAKIITAAVDVAYVDSSLRRLALEHSIPYVSGYAWLFAQAVASYRIVSGDTTTPLPYCSIEELKTAY